jgi:2,3-bisphosphoglycerate-dependent phosphoglycerate mutase
MAKLILVRHAKSEWNKLGLWTGLQDISLSDEGRVAALETARQLADIDIHAAYSSKLNRARETLSIILEALDQDMMPVAHEALNERDYGEFTGKNKWEVKEKIGEEEFQKLRRSWDYPVPAGESLKDVYHRVSKYYDEEISPGLILDKNTIIVAHGNSLRALMKHLEEISDEDISGVEIGVGEAHVYTLDKNGSVLAKEVRAENAQRGKI